MSVLKAIFDFYLNASIHVALAVCALVGVTWMHFELPWDYSLLAFVFFGSITGYNFIKYAGRARFHHRSLTRDLRAIQIFSLLCFIVLGWFAIDLPEEVWWTLGISALLTFLYAVPFVRLKSLRTLAGIKIFIVALVWAGVTVVVPLHAAGLSMDWDIWVTTLQRFLLVIALTLPFEIRDMNYDAIALATIPQQWGVRRTKFLGVVMLLLVVISEFLKDELNLGYWVIEVLVCIDIAFVLIIAQKEQPRYFASFVVESIPIVWCLLLFLFGKLF